MGCAGWPSLTNERALERAATQLQRQSDADSLAAAGLFRVTEDRVQAVALLARAEAIAPARADLIWLHLRVCQAQPSCDPQPEEHKLRIVSPGNGAGWLGALARAGAAHDDAAREAALVAIAHTERMDVYWTALIGHLSAAAARTGNLSTAEAMIAVTGIVAAVAIPAYAPLSNSCKGDRLQRSDIREDCRGVAQALENGDTVITEMMGVAIAKRVWPEDSAEWNAAVERRRVFQYRIDSWKPLEPVTWSATQALQYIALCLEHPREQDVVQAQLMNAGKAPNPPPG
jgi:hypothetical protein